MTTVYIKTYGCQANVADSAHLATYLEGLGCTIVQAGEDADLIIVNTCAIREKAEHRMFSYLGELADLRKEKPYLALGVIGCVASYRKKEMMARMPYLNFVFGARDDLVHFKAYITNLIESLATQKRLYYNHPEEYKPIKRRDKDIIGLVEKKGLVVAQDLKAPQKKPDEFKRSMINIMRGCNNYCSYCIVPFTRGREQSFAMSEIVAAVKRDVASGVKEITLIGQNVNSYKDPETGAGFEKLLEEVAKIEGEFWVRFVSPHPKDMTSAVIDVIAAHPEKLCSYIHLPLQSGSNRVLRAMNRTYTREQFLEQIAMIRDRLPYATISTDIIVGFPGETEEDYLATRDMMEKVRFHTVFAFIYSPRKYTKAAELPDDCSIEVKQKRLNELLARRREIGTQENEKLVGKTMRVLLEGDRGDGKFWGRTQGNVRMSVEGDDLVPNKFVDVKVLEARLTDIRSTSCHEAKKALN